MDGRKVLFMRDGVQYIVDNPSAPGSSTGVFKRPQVVIQRGQTNQVVPARVVHRTAPLHLVPKSQTVSSTPQLFNTIKREEDSTYGDYDGYDTKDMSPEFGEYDQQETAGGKLKRSSQPLRTSDSSKSLRFFSHRVCEKVKQKQHTTYNEVADELVQEYFLTTQPINHEKQQHDVKNIRRRVYDALNVLIALNIVSKDKKDISWVGVANPLAQDEQKELEEFVKQKQDEIIAKEDRVRSLLSELVSFKSLVEKNRQDERLYGRPFDNRVIHLPFMILATDKSTFVNCSISHDKSEVLCQFSSEYEILSDQALLEKLGHTYGVESGEVDSCNLTRVRSLIPPGLRNYLPIPQEELNLQQEP